MRERILVVDDEPSVLSICRDFLETRGFDVAAASSADEAIRNFEAGKFQLVITDINMPRMSGVDLMRWIKSREPEIPIIILTGYGTYGLMHEALRSGVSDFLDKPFNLETLEKSIGQALEKRRLLAERERLRVMRRLITTSEHIARELDEIAIMEYLLECLSKETQADSISVMLPRQDGDGKDLHISFSRGLPSDLPEDGGVRDCPVASMVFRQKKAIRVEDIRSDPRFGGVRLERYRSHSFLSVPMIVSDKVLGVINLAEKRDRSPFSQADEEVATILATQGAIALERARFYGALQAKIDEVESNFIGTVEAISNAIDAKSPWTKGHSERVTIYAGMIGRQLGLPTEELETLRLASLLHDVGKIGTCDALLDKPERLTPEEYEQVKRHPEKGEEILRPIERLRGILPIIRHHHERFDGRGYPDGLSGEEIPLMARILAVADTYDSMTSQRPYRKTPGRRKGLQELRDCAGTQFDPAVVDAFVRAFGQEGLGERRGAAREPAGGTA